MSSHKPHPPKSASKKCKCTSIPTGQHPPGTKPGANGPLSNVTIRQLLIRALLNRTTFAEVFTVATQIPGQPDLSNSRVVAVGADFVTFQQSASFGGALVTIKIKYIVGFETA